ncbi:MAG: two-component regulator propeller domain-containing protein [Spirochaetaceae bacterium]
MLCKKMKVALLALLLPILPAFAEPARLLQQNAPPRFESLTREDGLSNLSVSSVVQDSNGFLWFGTQGGLNRYDGREVMVFRHDPFDPNTLPHDLVQTIYYQEAAEKLWVGTYNGLSAFSLEEGTFTNYPAGETGLSNSVVIAVAEDNHGMIWVGTLRGLNRLNPATGEVDKIEIAGDVVRDITVDSRGTLWIGTYEGLFRLDPGSSEEPSASLEQVDITLPTKSVMSIREAEPGVLQLGCWEGGVVTYEISSGETSLLELEDNRIYAMTETRDGILWVGTWGAGLYAVEPSGEINHFSADSRKQELAHPIVYALFQDTSEILWIGTNGGGVQKISPRKRDFSRFTHDTESPRALPKGKVNVITRDSRQVLWFGIYNGGLNRYSEESDRIITYRHEKDDSSSLVNDIVNDVYETRDGELLIGTHGGINRFDRERERFELWGRDFNQEFPLEDQTVYAMEEDRNGRLWIGTYTTGVARVDSEKGELRSFSHDPEDPTSLSDNLIYDIYEDSRGRIWVATNNGLNLFRPEREDFRRFLHRAEDRSSLSSNTVRSIYEDSSGRIWIATVSGGLSRYEEESESFTHILASDGLASNIVVSLLEDDLGKLWVATHQGISIINPETGNITNLDENDGLAGVEFNPGAYRDEEGTLYFGAAHGVTGINQTAALRNPHAPRVHITDVMILQQSLSDYRYSFNDEALRVAPDERLVSFEFVGLEYEAPERNEYAYMLEGFDRDWINAGSRNFASYTALPPGQYTFKVRGSNNDGVWSDSPATVSLLVEAPLWRRWWAFLLYLLLLGAIVYGVVRVRESALVRVQNERLEEANAELERLSLHDPLTEIYNRRYFDSRLEEEVAFAQRSGRPLSLLMLDLDHFKEYNDRHGHVAGDQVLVSFARILERQIQRRTDFACRYGGEEFAVVLFDSDRGGAEEVARRILEAVRDIGVTVSIGVAVRGAGAEESEQSLVQAADAALYEAKRGGRDRYVTAG